MILVDSCVWIDLLKGKETPAVRRLKAIQVSRYPEVCLSAVVYFEVLRGIAGDLERKRVQRTFDLLERRDYETDDMALFVGRMIAAQRKGVVLKKLGDWLLLKTVLDHSLTLLTSDRDFYRLQTVMPFPLEAVGSS